MTDLLYLACLLLVDVPMLWWIFNYDIPAKKFFTVLGLTILYKLAVVTLFLVTV